MAFDKAKALQDANKYVTQGKIAKAIKLYEWVVENESGDPTLLNVIGDLYARENNVREALKCFYKLGDAYVREGYRLKAIAVYKKIVKLDQDAADPLLRLAELRSALGLAREAREHFKSALDFFERKGQQEQALDTLRKLCRLDPRNHGLRLNLAHVAERAGEHREAVEAYLGAAILARDNGDLAVFRSGLERAAELAPDNPEVHLLRARQALADKKPEEVGDILSSVPALQSGPEAKRLLLESYLATNNLDVASGLLLDVLESNPSNFAPAAGFIARCIENRKYELALDVLKRAAPMLIARRETGPLMEVLLRLWRACPEAIDVLELRYQVAKTSADEASTSEMLQALGDAYVESDQLDKAEQAYARLVAREPENETFKDLLRKVVEKQERERAPVSHSPLVSADGGFESDAVAWQFGCREGISPPAEQSAARADCSPPLQGEPAAHPVERPHLPSQPVEFNLPQAIEVGGTGAGQLELPPAKEIPLDFQSSQRDESSTGGPRISRADTSAEMPPQQNLVERSEALKQPFNYEESREEVEFYLRHGFYEEARRAVIELEKNYPAEDRVSEFRRSVDNAVRVASPTDMPQLAPATNEQAEEKAEWELPTVLFDGASGASPVRGDHAPAVLAAGDAKVELARHLRRELHSTADGLYDGAESFVSPAAQARVNGGPAAPGDASAELGSLLDELPHESDSADQTANDEQTHYNLGVAFREMGLLDEAIGELQKVVSGPGSKLNGPHFLQGCTLLASCFMEKEMPAIAAKWYLRALDAPGLDYEGTLALYYDLGLAFEKAGDTTAALAKFIEVYSQNIDYRDVAEKIRLLRQTSR